MARQDDENYWTSSGAKGFDFDSEDVTSVDNYFSLFGTSQSQTTQLSQQVKQNLNLTDRRTNNVHQKLKHSTSQSSLSSESSLGSTVKSTPVTFTPQFAVTSKLLSSTFQNEPVLSPQDAVRSLFLGLPVDLHSFKRISDKIALLNAAGKLGDGNVVSCIILHLQKTLSTEKLYSVLSSCAIPWHHYTAILQKQNRLKEAADFCVHLGKLKEAAEFRYKFSLQSSGICRLTDLQQSLKDLTAKKVSGIEVQAIQEHVDLLERQLPIFDNDFKLQSNLPKSNNLIGSPIIREGLVKAPLLATLQYCCQNHFNAAENLLTSPAALKKKFYLTERQYIWSAVIGRAMAGADPTSILITKSLLGSPKISGSVPLPRVLGVLHSLDCSPSVTEKLLPFIENPEQRLSLAKRFKSHRIAIEVLASQKDRLGLLSYKNSVDDHGLLTYLETILHQTGTKWKN